MTFVLPLALALIAPADAKKDEPKKADTAVPVTLYDGYFEKNDAGLKGASSVLAFATADAFGKVFAPVPPLLGGARPNHIPAGAFDSSLVVASVKRGTSLWDFSRVEATVERDVLTISYKATEKPAGGTATFACPLIASVPKGKYATVKFVENGKEVGTATAAK